jgi:hypothetical protein
MITNHIDKGCCAGGNNYKSYMKKIIYNYTKDENYFIESSKTFCPWCFGYDTNIVYYKDNYGYNSQYITNINDYYEFIKPYIRKKYQNDLIINVKYGL